MNTTHKLHWIKKNDFWHLWMSWIIQPNLPNLCKLFIPLRGLWSRSAPCGTLWWGPPHPPLWVMVWRWPIRHLYLLIQVSHDGHQEDSMSSSSQLHENIPKTRLFLFHPPAFPLPHWGQKREQPNKRERLKWMKCFNNHNYTILFLLYCCYTIKLLFFQSLPFLEGLLLWHAYILRR